MTTSIDKRQDGTRGFTLIETLLALALMGLVLSALASITAQWLPNWNRGVDRIQRSEVIGIALQRIGADLAATEYVTADRDTRGPLFEGSELSVTFVRTAFGPNAGPGLDVVRIGETRDSREFVTVRSRASFRPLPPASSLSEQIHLGDPVVLLRAPFRLSFAYAGLDRIWKGDWRQSDRLPTLIRLTVRDGATGRVLSVSTVTPVHVQVPSDCARPDAGCDGPSGLPKESQPDSRAGITATGQGGSL
jgi:general secretion pathway protein J